MAEEMRTLVAQEDVAAVAKCIHGPDAELLEYEVEKGTATVQGFLSQILRVVIKVQVGEQNFTSKFVAKRPPNLESQMKMVNEFGVFKHEIGIFERCAPILWKTCADLPMVRCYLTKENLIYMEDLKEKGFVALIQSVVDLREDVLTIEHIKMGIRTLAKFHAASVGVNWLEEFPDIFTEDVMFEKSDIMKNVIKQCVKKIVVPITKHHFNDEKFVKSSEWLASEEYLKIVTEICKPHPKFLNVLCHGDSWANNMMFKFDPETGNPLEIKLIDFQISRYAPGNRDLMYFIYVCCTPDFRKNYEKELLNTYWSFFTEECSRQHFELTHTWEQFCDDFDSIRPFGLMMSAIMRPGIFMDGAFPEGEEELTDEQFQTMMDGGSGEEQAIMTFKNNPKFRAEMISAIEEVAEL
ncbi:uncharacterized protein LOC132203727 [Neocloeon triangulifer]|uniref:uncharacterized protein LOC132203727 n=1 Tax=Neocloeon triangulifer TaxID=2078957 RepID=UPI00286F0FD7|nr:uncharacterized protein LOC132203727 [Neocloeon triangulifer]